MIWVPSRAIKDTPIARLTDEQLRARDEARASKKGVSRLERDQAAFNRAVRDLGVLPSGSVHSVRAELVLRIEAVQQQAIKETP